MTPRLPLTATLAAAALTLAACSGSSSTTTGGGGPSPDGPGTGMPPPADLAERADALLMTGSHVGWSLAAEGEPTIGDAYVERDSCTGARCVAADGTATTARELLDPAGAMDGETAEATTGTRGGFTTVTATGTFEEQVTETLPDLDFDLTVTPAVTSYGFWGAHGAAALALGAGPLTATIDGTAFTGDFSLAQAWAAGDATGMNPAGEGSATWTGIAEASPTGTPRRLQGTATVTIADLSRPRVGVAIAVPGHDIGGPGWADMALTDGRFTAGTAGTDYLAGSFHGPAHEEAWGVFDTTGYIGAFGAKRTP